MAYDFNEPLDDPMVDERYIDEVGQEEVSAYLDLVRESGAINMFGAGQYIREEFGVTKQEAREFLTTWMQNFGKKE